jgi:hypothetical protein
MDQHLRAFSKADLREAAFINSPMPSYATTLTAQELTDVVSSLSSLRTR